MSLDCACSRKCTSSEIDGITAINPFLPTYNEAVQLKRSPLEAAVSANEMEEWLHSLCDTGVKVTASA